MATPPPGSVPEPPSFPAGVGRIAWDEAGKILLDTLMQDPNFPIWLAARLKQLAPIFAGSITAFFFAIQSDLGKLIGQHAQRTAEIAGPPLLEIAAFGLSDFFNTKIEPGQLHRGGGEGGSSGAARQLGKLVLDSMFGQLEGGEGGERGQGQRNAERMITFGLSTALESWMMGVTGLGFLQKYFPNWADLGDIVSSNLGIGRIQRRVLQPAMNALIIDPWTAELNERFRPARLSEGQATRALHARWISEDQYFGLMARRGWSREDAGLLRILGRTEPSSSDVAAAYELGYIEEPQLEEHFRRAGYDDDWARILRANVVQDRVRTQNNRLESLAADMYAHREIDEGKLDALLRNAGRSPAEIEAIRGVAQIERSRPKAIPKGDIERAFAEGIVSLDQLRRWYQVEGYSGGDIVVLEMLALNDRLAYEERHAKKLRDITEVPPKEAPRGDWEAAFVKGLVTVDQLRGALLAQRYSADSVTLMVQLAAGKRADAERAAQEREADEKQRQEREAQAAPPGLSKADIEAAYVAGDVGRDELAAWYDGHGYSAAAASILLGLAENKRRARGDAERRARQRAEAAAGEDEARARAAELRAPPGPSRSDIEAAYMLGLVSEVQLHARLLELGYSPTTADLLVEIAVERRFLREAPRPTRETT